MIGTMQVEGRPLRMASLLARAVPAWDVAAALGVMERNGIEHQVLHGPDAPDAP